jgi:hypothetical protein
VRPEREEAGTLRLYVVHALVSRLQRQPVREELLPGTPNSCTSFGSSLPIRGVQRLTVATPVPSMLLKPETVHLKPRGAEGQIFQRSLSLLVSNLSSTRSKASVLMRAPPEKGCSMAPMVNSTRPITAARVNTISLCAQVFSRPNR